MNKHKNQTSSYSLISTIYKFSNKNKKINSYEQG